MVTTGSSRNINSALHGEHQDLFNLVYMLYETNTALPSKEDKIKVLAKIIRKSHLHFIFEETLFDKHGYPRADEHKEHHRAFIQQLDAMYLKYLSSREMSIASIADKLSKMIDEHNILHDSDFGRFITESLNNTEYAIEL